MHIKQVAKILWSFIGPARGLYETHQGDYHFTYRKTVMGEMYPLIIKDALSQADANSQADRKMLSLVEQGVALEGTLRIARG